MLSAPFEVAGLRQALGSFLTGVTIVTTLDDRQQPLGFTANSFTSVSLEPPLILVCMSKGSCNFDAYLNASQFAVNILAEHQREISTIFASPSEDRFRDIAWHPAPGGSPILEHVVAWFDCTTHEVIDAGDHIILLGRVTALDHNSAPPLGYLRGSYVHFALQNIAAQALENDQRKTCVGAIVEHEGRIYLCDDGDGGLQLPHSTHLEQSDNDDSLHPLLKSLGLSPSALYLFALFEDRQRQTSNIYYRVEIDSIAELAAESFYPLEALPFTRIGDPSLRSMLQRYGRERALNAFGIYVGDEYSGSIELLRTSTNPS